MTGAGRKLPAPPLQPAQCSSSPCPQYPGRAATHNGPGKPPSPLERTKAKGPCGESTAPGDRSKTQRDQPTRAGSCASNLSTRSPNSAARAGPKMSRTTACVRLAAATNSPVVAAASILMHRASAVGPRCTITSRVVRCFAPAKSVERNAVACGSASNAAACRGGAGGAVGSTVARPISRSRNAAYPRKSASRLDLARSRVPRA